ncbi:MAG TPA: carbamoyltransferase HypF [Longimicrobiales bacterium]|nr:carbamoyltransferase HypF [Longimicrobiales bacterium]
MSGAPARLRIRVRGAVQGVGFRPFVYRLAHSLGVAGWVSNDTGGVIIEAEAAPSVLRAFLAALAQQAPPQARVQAVDERPIAALGAAGFSILPSQTTGLLETVMLPDLATCGECLAEVLDPADRRSGYAFTNCTSCGPRFTIIQALPYDRPNTTMSGFRMCGTCDAEYHEPLDRRFHAQPNACPSCGPHLALHDAAGDVLDAGDDGAIIRRAVAELEAGRILAIKGLGGFHLMVDATSEPAVRRLRERKHRPVRPFALMVRDADAARALCTVGEEAALLLRGPAAPIVLLDRREDACAAAAVAPGQQRLGVMLPAMPLQHLLLAAFRRPVVATSGNLSDEPICISSEEAFDRLRDVADLFLTHDRPIARHVDDSVAFFAAGAPRLLRRARGYAPLPVTLRRPVPDLLAVGAQLKNTIALARGRDVFLSQHIGDLEAVPAQRAFERVISDFLRMYQGRPVAIAHDLHPDYAATQWAARFAAESGVPLISVQHHHAHHAACLAENRREGPALGVVWDGTGLGTDRTIWGGEFLLGDAAGVTRVAHLRTFRLPGGDAAIQEPRRSTLALLHERFGADALRSRSLLALESIDENRRDLLLRMLERNFHTPVTSSAGRLLDGLAVLLGLSPVATYEGQAAIELEALAAGTENARYPLALQSEDGALVLDWRPLLDAVLADLVRGIDRTRIAARIHNGLAAGIAQVCARADVETVALSGGCFQNRLLLERTVSLLRTQGHEVLLHAQVPPNDGGIALGQIAVAAARLAQQEV